MVSPLESIMLRVIPRQSTDSIGGRGRLPLPPHPFRSKLQPSNCRGCGRSKMSGMLPAVQRRRTCPVCAVRTDYYYMGTFVTGRFWKTSKKYIVRRNHEQACLHRCLQSIEVWKTHGDDGAADCGQRGDWSLRADQSFAIEHR